VAPPDARTDAELIDAANAGDVAAFEALYARHRAWVLRVARRYVRDDAVAADVLQETFLYLLGKFPGFVLTARLTTFLYPVIRNNALAARRKGRRELQADVPAKNEPTAIASHADTDDLAALLQHLPEAHREVLLMRYVDDLTPTEIAAVLEIPVGTVKSRLFSAVEKLRANPRVRRYWDA
jgi:RNA polymerase sigma-70 factor (ECF subfamily)